MSKFWKFIKNEATETTPESVELRIDGQIISDDDTWFYEWLGISAASPNTFREELNQYEGKDITIWIDSPGGDVFAGAGIYTALKEHKGKVTAKISGRAMSAASVIAMAADEILMSPVSIMMIHNPISSTQGYASDMRKTADVLDVVKDTILNAYVLKTGKSKNIISSMMNDESYMSANVAVKDGFADGVLYNNDKKEIINIKDFEFNHLAIQNSVNESIKRLIILQNKSNKPNKKEEETIMDLKELKDKYPDVYKDAYNEGIKNERERLKGIDDIAGHADIKLVNKAKYEEPKDAKDLAIEIIKADGDKGQKYLNDLGHDAEKGNTEKVPPALDKSDDDPKNIDETKIKNAASKIASYFRGGVK